jgi:cytochrome c oxidase subunit IV
MIERLFRGFKAVLKGELLLWVILLVLSAIIYLVAGFRL